MTREIIIWLLWITMIESAILLLMGTALAGRHLTDLEYQSLTFIDKLRNIESWTGVRTHVNRVLLAGTMLIICIMDLVQIDRAAYRLISWILIITTVTTFTLSSVLDWRAEYEKMKIFLSRKEQKDSYADAKN